MMKSRMIAGLALGSLSLVAIGVSAGLAPVSSSTDAASADETAITKAVSTLYDVISGDAGEERDWEAFQALFAYDARLGTFGRTREGGRPFRLMTTDEFQEGSSQTFETTAFKESAVHNEIDVFGNIAHVFSTYESLIGEGGPDRKPEARGINSIQLVKTGEDWKVLSIIWDTERPDNMIPAKYDAAADK